MPVLKILVDDVDAAIVPYLRAGFALEDRWGPPFAILAAGDTRLWISGPPTSAAKLTAQLSDELARLARVRPVLEVVDVDAAIPGHLAEGWSLAAGPVSGPGGTQALLQRGSAVLEVFAGR
jgi:hypothetical protein